MAKKEKIIISILCIIIALLMIGIASSFTERVVYYFDNRTDVRNFESPLYIDDYYPLYYYYSWSYVARVKYIEKKHNFDEDKRAEYVFEIIEWINTVVRETDESQIVDTTLKKISLYSNAYPQKWITYRERVEKAKNIEFIEGFEYILVISKNSKGIPCMYEDTEAICITDLSKSIFLHNKSEKVLDDNGITSVMGADEIVTRVKELIQIAKDDWS